MGTLTHRLLQTAHYSTSMSWYYITASNGMVLDIHSAKEGGKLILYNRHGGDNQLWRFQDGMLVSKTGLVADMQGASREPGTQLIAWQRHGEANQRFHQHNDSIVSNLHGLVFNVRDGNLRADAEVVMWPSHGGHTQSFTLVRA